MSTVGIKVFNADGSLQFDSNNRLFLTLLDFMTSGASGSKTFSNPGVGTVVAAQVDNGGTPPTVSISGNTVSWTGGNTNSRIRVMVL